MMKQLKARTFPQSAKGARNEKKTEFLIKKLKGGLAIQALSAILALVNKSKEEDVKICVTFFFFD